MNTKTPSGLTIVRENMKFTFGWKIADKDHDSDQQIQWRTNLFKAGQWETLPLSEKATSKTVTLQASDYNPSQKKYLKMVSFRIRGKRAPYQENNATITPGWSDWARRDFNVLEPGKPSGSAELTDPIVTKFSWSAGNNTKNNHPFFNVLWQTVLVKECNESDGNKITFSSSKPGWDTNTGNASGNKPITEDSVILRNNSYTRWFRVRAQGARGNSDWRFLKHVYAYPKKPAIKTLRSSMSGGVTVLNLTWKAPTDAAHPIDLTTVEYCVETPETNMTCPGTATWNEARTQKDTDASDGARVAISAGPIVDQAMWVRLKCTHDYNDTYSDAWFVRSGRLPNPGQITVSVDSSTHMATISAANNSTVPDSRLAVLFTTDKKNSQALVIGIISSDATSVTVKCPEWDTGDHVAFGVYAFQGTETHSTDGDGVTTYAIDANMKSGIVWEGGDVPLAPADLEASVSDTPGEVILTWDWAWTEANSTELSWSQNPNAWESTDEPETYMITNLNQPRWRVSGLETGVRWYFRARFANVSGDDYNYGPYSETVEVDLTSAPVVPILALSRAIIAQGDTLTASWAYTTTDGTSQAFADICEADVTYETDDYGVDPATEDITYGDIIAHETSAQHVNITPKWETGSTHYLCVRVTSASGHVSEWSKPVSVLVADPISCEITDSSIETITITDLDGNQRTVDALTDMPLDVTVEGAGTTGLTTVIIERAAEYHMIRPDGGTADGYDKETIAIIRQNGEDEITIGPDDLIGFFDDGASYRLIATVEDSYGQTASDELEFEVHWTHQAEVPTAYDTITNGIAYIRADVPESYVQGDVIDIYRLSKDKPELIVQNGDYDTVYMDPYPTIGNYGHRVVARTVNGDYITEDGTPAWVDLPALYNEYSMIIDFDGGQLVLSFDIALQHKWSKDFKVTNYLGGSQQGDWNTAIDRTGTYTTDLVEGMDDELIEGIRTLARHSGICHVRTPEGSSYAADVQVSESQGFSTVGIVSFTMSVTRVDPETLDGITLED